VRGCVAFSQCPRQKSSRQGRDPYRYLFLSLLIPPSLSIPRSCRRPCAVLAPLGSPTPRSFRRPAAVRFAGSPTLPPSYRRSDPDPPLPPLGPAMHRSVSRCSLRPSAVLPRHSFVLPPFGSPAPRCFPRPSAARFVGPSPVRQSFPGPAPGAPRSCARSCAGQPATSLLARTDVVLARAMARRPVGRCPGDGVSRCPSAPVALVAPVVSAPPRSRRPVLAWGSSSPGAFLAASSRFPQALLRAYWCKSTCSSGLAPPRVTPRGCNPPGCAALGLAAPGGVLQAHSSWGFLSGGPVFQGDRIVGGTPERDRSRPGIAPRTPSSARSPAQGFARVRGRGRAGPTGAAPRFRRGSRALPSDSQTRRALGPSAREDRGAHRDVAVPGRVFPGVLPPRRSANPRGRREHARTLPRADLADAVRAGAVGRARCPLLRPGWREGGTEGGGALSRARRPQAGSRGGLRGGLGHGGTWPWPGGRRGRCPRAMPPRRGARSWSPSRGRPPAVARSRTPGPCRPGGVGQCAPPGTARVGEPVGPAAAHGPRVGTTDPRRPRGRPRETGCSPERGGGAGAVPRAWGLSMAARPDAGAGSRAGAARQEAGPCGMRARGLSRGVPLGRGGLAVTRRATRGGEVAVTPRDSRVPARILLPPGVSGSAP